jgi:DNA-binding MarR family transcriptional regulator
VSTRLGYLLKHAYLSYSELSAEKLEPYGIDGRELAILSTLDGQDPPSQQEIARQLNVDRTTMVGMVDRLEAKKLVRRRPHPDDRRKNVVELTATGRTTLAGATRAATAVERRFLEPLGPDGAAAFTQALRTLLSSS